MLPNIGLQGYGVSGSTSGGLRLCSRFMLGEDKRVLGMSIILVAASCVVLGKSNLIYVIRS